MIVIHTSLLFMTLTNAYPTTDHLARRDYRTPLGTQRACSAPDSTLPFPLFMLADDGSSLKDCSPGGHCYYVCQAGYTPSSYDINNYGFVGATGGNVLCRADGTLDLSSGSPLCTISKENIYVTTFLLQTSSFCQKGGFNGFNFFLPSFLQHRVLTPLALPTTSYTSFLYYFNSPGGNSPHECPAGFSKGSTSIPSPYLLQVSKDSNGHVIFGLGWNPHYASNAFITKDSLGWGIKILCQGVDCQPCYIDPSKHNVNECENCEPGNGGSFFCQVKVSSSIEAVVFLFSSGSGENSDSFTGFSSVSSGASISEEHRTVTQESLGSRSLTDERKTQDGLTESDGITREDQFNQKEGIMEQAQHSKIDSRPRGDQDRESHHGEGLSREVNHGSLSLTREINHGSFKGQLDNGAKHSDDFKGFFYGNSASFDKESNKGYADLSKLPDSLSVNGDVWKSDECKTAATGSAQKPSNSQLDLIPTDPESPKQENSILVIHIYGLHTLSMKMVEYIK
ncbi:hypothetical protein MERGE_002507 [Pneumocystis wakefieldiae]|uniref:SUN domain-containing protein n=1 Tax=Pneumocystis wakefieldiae TaxID=38082 RepID=A0A899FMI3_9ASCO|nr:hypothetical protein MERGE_002507 [Pneumocystis wakefieldiae]